MKKSVVVKKNLDLCNPEGWRSSEAEKDKLLFYMRIIKKSEKNDIYS